MPDTNPEEKPTNRAPLPAPLPRSEALEAELAMLESVLPAETRTPGPDADASAVEKDGAA